MQRMDVQYDRQLINLFARRFHHPEVVFAVLNDNYELLGELAAVIRSDPDQKDLLDRIQARVLELVKQATIDTLTTQTLGRGWEISCREQAKHRKPPIRIPRALVTRLRQHQSSIAIGKFTGNYGRRDEAIREVKICLRISPQLDEAKGMLERLSGPTPAPRDPEVNRPPRGAWKKVMQCTHGTECAPTELSIIESCAEVG